MADISELRNRFPRGTRVVQYYLPASGDVIVLDIKPDPSNPGQFLAHIQFVRFPNEEMDIPVHSIVRIVPPPMNPVAPAFAGPALAAPALAGGGAAAAFAPALAGGGAAAPAFAGAAPPALAGGGAAAPAFAGRAAFALAGARENEANRKYWANLREWQRSIRPLDNEYPPGLAYAPGAAYAPAAAFAPAAPAAPAAAAFAPAAAAVDNDNSGIIGSQNSRPNTERGRKTRKGSKTRKGIKTRKSTKQLRRRN